MAVNTAVVKWLTMLKTKKEEYSWKEIFDGINTFCVRNYYLTKNTIQNIIWPSSPLTIVGLCAILFGIILYEPQAGEYLTSSVLKYLEQLPFLEGTQTWLKEMITTIMIGSFVMTIFILIKIRQYILRSLFSYHGWLYENGKSKSKATLIWGGLLKLFSGSSPLLYSCQNSLPRQPVPDLPSTLKAVLESLKPLTDKEEFAQLVKEAEDLEKGPIGRYVQKLLVLKSCFVPNYVTDWWEKYVYLTGRSPLPINSNYFGLDQSYWTPTRNQTARAGTVINQLLVVKRMIDRQELQPLMIQQTIPLCMEQYKRMFSTIRMPGEKVDELLHFGSAESKHIVVNYRGLYYSVDCYDAQNQILTPANLQSQFDWIIKDGDARLKQTHETPEAARNISSLTSLPRSEWAKVLKKHFMQGDNHESFEAIKKAIMMIVLSEESPTSLTERGKCLFYGDGKTLWFDKSVSVVFFKNGHCGLNVEHTMADAAVMCHIWEYPMVKEITEKWYTNDGSCIPVTHTFKQSAFKSPTKLNWNVSDDLALEINNAIIFAQKNNADLDLQIGDHSEWGKGLIKKCRISPDAFIQVALQYAYYKDAGTFTQTYEASMTRFYSHGRTETVRSCTQETVAFIKAMVQNNISKDEKKRLLNIAAERHQKLYRDAMTGKGVDRHLFALYVCSKGLNYESPFLNNVLGRPWTLSTSQQPQQQIQNLPSRNLPLFDDKVSPGGGFGCVSPEGYGVSYMIPSDHKIFFHVTSKHSCSRTSSKRFLENIFQSMEELKNIFE